MSKVSKQATATGGRAGKLAPFLRKLQDFVSTAVPVDVGAWNEDGTRFLVIDRNRFDELVKEYFQWTGAQTFNRQLSLYEFSKDDSPPSFGHPCFLRDNAAKIYEIKRQTKTTSNQGEGESAEQEEEGSATRVQHLETQVTSLQSLVDDLSVKLAKIQTSLQGAGHATSASAAALSPAQSTLIKHKARRPKRGKAPAKEETEMQEVHQQVISGLLDSDLESFGSDDEASAQEFLSSYLSSPQFHDALSSTGRQQSPEANSASLGAGSTPRREKIY